MRECKNCPKRSCSHLTSCRSVVKHGGRVGGGLDGGGFSGRRGGGGGEDQVGGILLL